MPGGEDKAHYFLDCMFEGEWCPPACPRKGIVINPRFQVNMGSRFFERKLFTVAVTEVATTFHIENGLIVGYTQTP